MTRPPTPEEIAGIGCPYPVVHAMKQCCGTTPCSLEWFRPCDAEGGCWDRATCPGCDTPVRSALEGQRDAG